MLAASESWLQAERHAHMTRAVSFVRGVLSVSVLATVGRTVFDVEREFGVVESVESRDFLVLATTLVLGGNLVTPQPGDRILETMGASVFTYEVSHPIGSETPWRFSDQNRETIRIHTKLVSQT